MTNYELRLECIRNLNLDEIDETNSQISSLLHQAQAVLTNAINTDVPMETYLNDHLFIAACEALTTQMFYDRTLENNISLGIQMMIVQLQARYANYQPKVENGGDSNGNA